MNTAKFVQFSKPFIDATEEVFSSMIQTSIQPQSPQIKKSNTSKGDVSAVIGMSGTVTQAGVTNEFKGQFVLSFPEVTYLKVASAMLMEEYTELCDEISDVAAEICNIIIGNTKRELNQQGFKIDMAIPSTVTGKNHGISYPRGVNVILIPVESAHGVFFMEICFQDF